MKISTMLQSKILKTKKRLSDQSFYLHIMTFGFIGLLAIFIYCFRVISQDDEYGYITADIPVLSEPVQDSAFHRYTEKLQKKLTKTTALVILTDHAYYFGDLDAFSDKFIDSSNKFMIRHRNGEPQLGELLENMRKWDYQRATNNQIAGNDIVVFLPASYIPMPLVIQTIDGLKKSPLFKNVILANGLI